MFSVTLEAMFVWQLFADRNSTVAYSNFVAR